MNLPGVEVVKQELEEQQNSENGLKTVIEPSQWSFIPENGVLSMQVVTSIEYEELAAKQAKTDERFRLKRRASIRGKQLRIEEYKKLLEIHGFPKKAKLSHNVMVFLAGRKKLDEKMKGPYLETVINNIDPIVRTIFGMTYCDCSQNEERFMEMTTTSQFSTEVLHEVYRRMDASDGSIQITEETKLIVQRLNSQPQFHFFDVEPTDGWTTTNKINTLLDRLHPTTLDPSSSPPMSADENHKPISWSSESNNKDSFLQSKMINAKSRSLTFSTDSNFNTRDDRAAPQEM